jgi:ubiquinol-cytochrome c reductase cytochrome b subunit
MRTVWRWLDERLEVSPYIRAFLDRVVPNHGWWHTFGSATLFLLIVQVTTGIALTISYVPAPDHAYQSIAYIDSTPFGALVRSIHHWAAGVLVVLVALHALRVFAWAAYKYPRELNWIVGALLFIVVLGFAFTGYLLPWDQKAYWATVVGTDVAGQFPIIGGALLELLRGGTQLGASTLVRFYGLHIWVLPAILFLLVGIHLYALVKQGIAANPRLTPLTEAAPGESRRETYQREYAAAKRRGKPFYEQFLLDAIVSLGLFVVIVGLAFAAGAPLEPQADPNASGYVPRPEWYFLSLFQLLWYFSGPLEPLLISGLFTIAVAVFVLVPLLDRNPERHPRRRPIALGLAGIAVVGVVGLTYLGATSAPSGLPTVAAHAGMSQQELSGLTIFNEQGCTACHSVGGVGGDAGADLSHIGSEMDAQSIREQLLTPQTTNMPAFDQLTAQQLDDLIAFLQSLR